MVGDHYSRAQSSQLQLWKAMQWLRVTVALARVSEPWGTVVEGHSQDQTASPSGRLQSQLTGWSVTLRGDSAFTGALPTTLCCRNGGRTVVPSCDMGVLRQGAWDWRAPGSIPLWGAACTHPTGYCRFTSPSQPVLQWELCSPSPGCDLPSAGNEDFCWERIPHDPTPLGV